MRIFCEDTLTYGPEFFDDMGDVTYFSASEINSTDLVDVDCLFVRSTTKVDEALLCSANELKMVATATAGTDHVDQNYLQTKGIHFASAAGCNAIAVAEYVIASLLYLAKAKGFELLEKRVAIIGCGHVGSTLEKKLRALGIAPVLCDPPLQESGDNRSFSSFDDAVKCDVICLHVPLVEEGKYPTRDLFDIHRLDNLSKNQILVNACRGEVVNNAALLQSLEGKEMGPMVFDVWEFEPNINFDLSKQVDIATQHIAGHTIEGKARGTEMVYQAAAEYFGFVANKTIWDFLPPVESPLLDYTDGDLNSVALHDLVRQVYDISEDCLRFKGQVNTAESFRYSRKNYAIRREFAAYQVNTGKLGQSQALYGLGFSPYEKEC